MPSALVKKKLSFSISDFAWPAPRKGSIDANSGFGRQAAQIGTEIHQRVQAARVLLDKNYQKEIAILSVFEKGDFSFEIQGRMDGIIEKPSARIEEIKSSFNIHDLARQIKDGENDHPYSLQLRTYGYFYYLQKNTVPELNLHLVSSRNFESLDLKILLDINSYESWLELRLQELVEEAVRAEKTVRRRKKIASKLQFPFPQPRAGQVELIETIQETMKGDHPLLIQAPTGLGKTVGVMFPALQEALSRGQKLIYVTPKNSQHAVAEEAIEKFQQAGAAVRAMTLTAKSKMCFKNEPICNPDFCEYAKDHYTKVAENNLVLELAKKKNLTERVFKNMAEEHQVCPFEIQLAAIQDVDTVIADYNYVFAPRAILTTLSEPASDQIGKPNLVIDEAHNLPARAMDYYSPMLSTFVLEKMIDEVQFLPRRFRSEFQSLVQECVSVVRGSGPKDCKKSLPIRPPVMAFTEQEAHLRQFLSTYLNSDVEIKPRDVVLRLSMYWAEFTQALQFVSSERKEFFTTFNPFPASIKITCCDAAEMLRDSYQNFQHVVAFSATLKPFEYYSRLSGFDEKAIKTAEFLSPFPKERRKILIIPQISSKYNQREQSYPKIAETITKIVSLQRGNYFVFLPSFDFLQRVSAQFKAPDNYLVLKQERSMKRKDIEAVLTQLRDPSGAHIIFAVQGGVFSEGVDYPGKMVIGAFVVGPPLPLFDLERETMKDYYQENYFAGFDYAYTYPAMAKAVQAAGRVIRSGTDKGIIILIDDRFVQSNYVKSMPQDWYEGSVHELVSTSILKDISDFWQLTV